jgi:hypothetical protein
MGPPTFIGNDFGIVREAATAEAASGDGVEDDDDELP